MDSKKVFIVFMLLVTVAIAGCLADSQTNQMIENNSNAPDNTVTSDNDNGDDVQEVRIVNSEPIKYENVRSYEVYWDWHNTTSDLLREHLGEDVKIYCYSLSYSGKLNEIGKYYILLDDNAQGLIYVDIDQITAISAENPTVNAH
ncbi:hypothetical protein SAMN04488589_2273 [Methanolobus vulcani]|jgi:hypothetical protein|uniref:Uncharacterized protein n=1 Tax=Methanolobus vulcani TaxID=38026 RepID=A0A7Z7AY34_9EURY|nr:hypothetical protein [Methanolobus vulcani]SDG14873.1 hypothetical protein SAMN04488589_2273 [Methanolobus vulcani]